jgi:hypothetical protein
MKILILPDSLSLPRSTPEICHHTDKWPERLRKLGHEVCLSAIGGATIKTLFKQTFYFGNTGYFDLVIIQSGIVDCAPPFARQREVKLLKATPVLGKTLHNALNTNFIRGIRDITYTIPNTFKEFVDKFDASYTCPVWYIPVLPASPAYEQRLPGVSKNIERFNQLLPAERIIDIKELTSNDLMSNFHHLYSKGNQVITNAIIQKIGNEAS